MKHKIITFLLFSILYNSGFAQSFNTSNSNHVNVYNPIYENEGRKNLIDATVKIRFAHRSQCSGTLINRNTSDGEVGYYILTARHCFVSKNGTGTNQFDSNATHHIIFNYQSPHRRTESTANSNRGASLEQSISKTETKYEYLHETKLRLVDHFFWGDFALLEILTPVPPHFDIAYAGWNPNKFNGSNLPQSVYPTRFVGIHHPKGDIKKIHGASTVLWLETPLATGCYTITTIIDFLFGWIWGNKKSTKVICNYVDNPWLTVPSFVYGTTEEGSSGSGIFNSSNQLIGVLSGPLNSYGKLHANYSKASIKNVLNPTHSKSVDLFGMGERKVTKYNNLVLPGGDGVSTGYYFPANHYQPENKITLQANNDISTNQPIIIFSEADYKFIAGNSIVLSPGFHAQSGSNFTAKIEVGNNLRKADMSVEEQIIERLRKIELPQQLDFDEKKYLYENRNTFSPNVTIYPNPTTGIVNIDQGKKIGEIKYFEIYNASGKLTLKQIPSQEIEVIDLQNQPAGIYLLRVVYDNQQELEKIILQ